MYKSGALLLSALFASLAVAQDWPNLGKYAADDVRLGAPAFSENRVVFLGDSITEGWNAANGGFFPDKPSYINRGISGQTTPQMLIRFRADVVALQPRVAVILAGTNDLAANTGPTTLAAIEDNFMSMCDIAKANGIQVVLASVTPVFDYPWKPGLQPVPKIAALNAWLKDYAARSGYLYLDYFSAMVDPTNQGMKGAIASDGVHPNKAGYAIMAPLAESAIKQALAK